MLRQGACLGYQVAYKGYMGKSKSSSPRYKSKGTFKKQNKPEADAVQSPKIQPEGRRAGIQGSSGRHFAVYDTISVIAA